ncbi:hypothetical protein [Vibrio mediterranei]|uniref:hypothetical protein n=1 Tax=Vibrio mediterranei TaxID=689 RepID=UPI0040688DC4
MISKTIVQASTCLRFHSADGWSRKEVAEMIDGPERGMVHFVVPSYFELEANDKVRRFVYQFRMDRSVDDRDFEDADYFAVYAPGITFCPVELSKHYVRNLVPA